MNPRLSILVGASALALLSACGGDGTNDNTVIEGVPFHVTADNQVGVARATLAGGLAVSNIESATSAGGDTPSSVTSRAHALASTVRHALAAGVGSRKTIASASAHPAAATTDTESCAAGGTMATTFDDRDGSQSLTTGDVLTVHFAQCRESATLIYDGTAVITLTSTPTATQIAADAVFQQLSEVDGSVTSTVDGPLAVVENDTGTATDDTLTAGAGGVAITLASTAFHDVASFAQGATVVVDTPASGDRFSVSLEGTMGIQSVTYNILSPVVHTISPLVQLATDAYPSSGVLRVSGNNSLLMTVIDATTVQLQVDDGSGTLTTTTVPWTTLLP